MISGKQASSNGIADTNRADTSDAGFLNKEGAVAARVTAERIKENV